VRITLFPLMLVATLSLAACGSTSQTTQATSQAASPAVSPAVPSAAGAAGASAMPAGAYLTQADYEKDVADRAGTKVVYFFHATWCPDCRATDAALTGLGVPAGLTVVKVDYDTATELRKTYGVTQQHTFVQVGPDGAQLAKWTGTKTGEAIKAKTL
jgi:thiol-disulfide isomerase/thioredoxin